MVCVCHSLAACQRHAPSSLAAVIGLSNNDVLTLRALRWLETPLKYRDTKRVDTGIGEVTVYRGTTIPPSTVR